MELVEEVKGKIEKKNKLDIWKMGAYFIIYSFLGFCIETLFALICWQVLESRKSFLYGPFCGIYGIGAVIIIIVLGHFNKNNKTLFIGGFIVGTIIEYLISLLAELFLNVYWWDYSNNFLNINGRVCLKFSILWGVLGIVLMKTINPKVEHFIDFVIKKIKLKKFKIIIISLIVFLAIDCAISGIAISLFTTRMIAINDLEVENKQQIIERYNQIYSNERLSKIIYTLWSDKRMIMVYPNLKTDLADGTVVYMKDLNPDIKPYYYKFK